MFGVSYVPPNSSLEEVWCEHHGVPRLFPDYAAAAAHIRGVKWLAECEGRVISEDKAQALAEETVEVSSGRRVVQGSRRVVVNVNKPDYQALRKYLQPRSRPSPTPVTPSELSSGNKPSVERIKKVREVKIAVDTC
jgi:hypothetical protein